MGHWETFLVLKAYNLVLLTGIPVVCMSFEALEGADFPKLDPDPVVVALSTVP